MLQTELLPDSDSPLIISNIDDALLLPDRDCILILPYGLAAHLLLTEDPESASFFNNRYEYFVCVFNNQLIKQLYNLIYGYI